MLSLAQDLVILIVTLAASLLFMVLLNRLWTQEKRSVNNDLIGWQLTIVGTTYAVILGFMLYTVWTAYGEAQINVDLEANALRDLYRSADGLPEPQRTQLKHEARAYAAAVIDHDWPQMAEGKVPEGSHLIDEAMWKTAMTIKPESPTEVIYTNQLLNHLTTLTEHRRTRMLRPAKTVQEDRRPLPPLPAPGDVDVPQSPEIDIRSLRQKRYGPDIIDRIDVPVRIGMQELPHLVLLLVDVHTGRTCFRKSSRTAQDERESPSKHHNPQ